MITSEEKSKRLEQASQSVWAMFEFVVSGRMKVENTLAFFLAINTLFIVGFLELFKTQLESLSIIHLIPFLLLVLPSFALFVGFASSSIRVPWLEKETLTESLENSKFHTELLSEVYASAYQSHDALKRALRMLRICLLSVGFAVVWLIVMFLHAVCSSTSAWIEKIIIFVMVAGGLITCIYLTVRNLQVHPYEESKQGMKVFFKNWLSSDGAKHTPTDEPRNQGGESS